MSRQPGTGAVDECARPAEPAPGTDERPARVVVGRVKDSPLRVVGAALSGLVVVVAVGLVVLLAVLPKATGGAALTVLSGSMQPTLRPGDVAVVRGVGIGDVCDKVEVGDIVTYLPEPDDPSLITHRVVAKTVGTFDDGTACRLVTQGDANTSADRPVSPTQVRGVFWYGLPKLGSVKQQVLDHPTAALVVVAVVTAAWWLVPPRRRVITVSVPGPDGQDPAAGGLR